MSFVEIDIVKFKMFNYEKNTHYSFYQSGINSVC
jgi:hypothetical protein